MGVEADRTALSDELTQSEKQRGVWRMHWTRDDATDGHRQHLLRTREERRPTAGPGDE